MNNRRRLGWAAAGSVAALAALAALAVGGCGPFIPGKGKSIMNVAHRGASAYAPENTLASFAKAIELGADWFELDCYLVEGDAVICIHDDTLDRTTNGAGAIADKTLAELKQFDAGSWKGPQFAGERLPTLEEALRLADNKIGVYIEVKDSKERNERLSERVVEIVQRQRAQRRVVVQSFVPEILLAVGRLDPSLRLELLGDGREESHFAFAKAHCAGFNPHHETVTAELVDRCHAAGLTITCWTVNEPERMRELLEMGVDGIITNRPDVLNEVIEAHFAGK